MAFPVSVSLGVYRAGKGNGELELIAAGVADDLTRLAAEFGQGGAQRGGAHAAELAQALHGSRSVELGQGLAHALERGEGASGLSDGPAAATRQGQRPGPDWVSCRGMWSWEGAARCSVDRVSWAPLRRR